MSSSSSAIIPSDIINSSEISSTIIPPELLPYLLGEKEDYSSVQDSVIQFNVIFAVLVAVATVLRIFVRFHLIRAAGLDDNLMIVAVSSAFILNASCLAGAHYGLGEHVWNLDTNLFDLPRDVGRLAKILFACYLAYATAITFTKCSIIASYIRLFPHRHMRRASLVTGFVVISFWICSIFCICLACIPIQALWDYSITDAKCFPLVNFFYVAAGFNIATDIVLCVLPLPTLWGLKMPRPQRIVVCLLFSLGLFACISSTLRLTQLHYLNGMDLSYQTVGSLNWSVAEVGTAIVCSSTSVLRPLAVKVFPTFFAHLSRGTDVSLNNMSTRQRSLRYISDPAGAASHQGSCDEILEHNMPEIPQRTWPVKVCRMGS